MNAAFTTVTSSETSDKHLPGLESLQILTVRTKKVIIMIARGIILGVFEFKEASSFL